MFVVSGLFVSCRVCVCVCVCVWVCVHTLRGNTLCTPLCGRTYILHTLRLFDGKEQKLVLLLVLVVLCSLLGRLLVPMMWLLLWMPWLLWLL